MQQCQIDDTSLKYSRATYGALTLVAFFIRSEWLVFAVAILVILGAFSFKLNLPYQLFSLMLKKKSTPVQKESAELSFVAAMTGTLLLVGFALVYFDIAVNFGWIFILLVTLLIFLACFVGFCVATLMYVLIRKLFRKNAAPPTDTTVDKGPQVN